MKRRFCASQGGAVGTSHRPKVQNKHKHTNTQPHALSLFLKSFPEASLQALVRRGSRGGHPLRAAAEGPGAGWGQLSRDAGGRSRGMREGGCWSDSLVSLSLSLSLTCGGALGRPRYPPTLRASGRAPVLGRNTLTWLSRLSDCSSGVPVTQCSFPSCHADDTVFLLPL